MTERLEYTFDDPKADAVTVTLRWEKLALPFVVSVNSTQVVMDSLQQQLRGLPKFFPDAWRQASMWAMQHDQLATASAWADTAIGLGGHVSEPDAQVADPGEGREPGRGRLPAGAALWRSPPRRT